MFHLLTPEEKFFFCSKDPQGRVSVSELQIQGVESGGEGRRWGTRGGHKYTTLEALWECQTTGVMVRVSQGSAWTQYAVDNRYFSQ